MNQIPAVGFLRHHPLNTRNVEAAARTQQIMGDRDNEVSKPKLLDIGEHPQYSGEGDELAWKHFQKAVEVASEPLDRPSQHMDPNLDPPRMRAAMGPDWKGLKPFQRDGVGMIVAAEKGQRGAAKGVLLADSMGMGKTVQVIAAFETHQTDRTNLFVLPASLFDNWLEELTKFLKPNPKILIYDGTQVVDDFNSYDIVFVTYNRLRNEYICHRKILEGYELCQN